jgi:hypothetical protein
MPNVPKKIADQSINMAPLKKMKKSCELTHDLINMNHTLCPQNLVINHHQKLFFTICPYPESYFLKKIWMMPKHSWTPELYMFWVCNEFKAKFHHSTDFITPILSGNWADMRKEMQE